MSEVKGKVVVNLESAFYRKFANPSDGESNLVELTAQQGADYLMLSLKHSGSLMLISPDARFSTKHSADEKFVDVARLVFGAWMGEDLENFLSLMKKNQLSIGFELVVPRILGDHPGIPTVPYFAVTCVTDLINKKHLSPDNLIRFCAENKLPCGEHWFIPNSHKEKNKQGLKQGLIDSINQIRFESTVDASHTANFIKKITDLTKRYSGITVPGNIPHDQVQGDVCEGMVGSFISVPEGWVPPLWDVLLDSKQGVRLQRLEKLGQWFKDNDKDGAIFIDNKGENSKFFEALKKKADKELPKCLFNRTGIIQEKNKNQYWLLEKLEASESDEAKELLKSLKKLPSLEKARSQKLKLGKLKKDKNNFQKKLTEIKEKLKKNSELEIPRLLAAIDKVIEQSNKLDESKVGIGSTEKEYLIELNSLITTSITITKEKQPKSKKKEKKSLVLEDLTSLEKIVEDFKLEYLKKQIKEWGKLDENLKSHLIDELKSLEKASSSLLGNKLKFLKESLLDQLIAELSSSRIDEKDNLPFLSLLHELKEKKLDILMDQLSSLAGNDCKREALIKSIREKFSFNQKGEEVNQVDEILKEFSKLNQLKGKGFCLEVFKSKTIGELDNVVAKDKKKISFNSEAYQKLNEMKELKGKLKETLKGVEEILLGFLKEKLNDLHREIDDLWKVTVYELPDGSYRVHIKVEDDRMLIGVDDLHIFRGHVVGVYEGDSLKTLDGIGDELDESVKKRFEASNSVQQVGSTIKFKNQIYMELRSIRETCNRMLNKLIKGFSSDDKEFKKIAIQEFNTNYQPMFPSNEENRSKRINDMAVEAYNKLLLEKFFQYLLKEGKPYLPASDMFPKSFAMFLYEKFKQQQKLCSVANENGAGTTVRKLVLFFEPSCEASNKERQLGEVSSQPHMKRVFTKLCH